MSESKCTHTTQSLLLTRSRLECKYLLDELSCRVERKFVLYISNSVGPNDQVSSRGIARIGVSEQRRYHEQQKSRTLTQSSHRGMTEGLSGSHPPECKPFSTTPILQRCGTERGFLTASRHEELHRLCCLFDCMPPVEELHGLWIFDSQSSGM